MSTFRSSLASPDRRLLALAAALAFLASPALGTAGSTYVPVNPCRVVDTRQVPNGIMVAGVPRQFDVVGSGPGFAAQGGKAGGCGIPGHAIFGPVVEAVMFDFVAVQPLGDGDLRVWPEGPAPNASVLNYGAAFNIANGVVVPLAQDVTPGADLSVLAAVSDTHLVIDVLGYFLGSDALQNTAVGTDALRQATGTNNTALGFLALELTGSGGANTAVGSDSLGQNTIGSFNTAVGYAALPTAASDSANTAVGSHSLTSTLGGGGNTALGTSAMLANTTGGNNVAVGFAALDSNTVGYDNVAIGTLALEDNLSGVKNVSIGTRSGDGETGSYRLHIGSDLGTLIYGQFDNERVGIAATDPTVTLDVDGQIRSRSLGTGSVCADANGVLGGCVSDARLKVGVRALGEVVDVLPALAQLRGVLFDWNAQVPRAAAMGSATELGLVAQEVQAVLPQVVRPGTDGYLTVDYARLVAFLIEVQKAQQRRIEALEDQLRGPRALTP